MMKIADVECYKNFFMVVFLNLTNDDYDVYINYKGVENFELKNYLKDKKLITYNGKRYDDYMITNACFTKNNQKLYDLSQVIISNDNIALNFYHVKKIVSIDLMEYIREGYTSNSLKGVAVNMKHHRIQDLPIEFDADIDEEQIELLKEYCLNDCVITKKLFFALKEKVIMRSTLTNLYNVDLMSESDSGITKKMFAHYYPIHANKDWSEIKKLSTIRTNLLVKDIIFPYISFKTDYMKSFLNDVKRLEIFIPDSKLSKEERKKLKKTYSDDNPDTVLNGLKQIDLSQIRSDNILKCKMAEGGIHSDDPSRHLKSSSDYFYIDIDIASMYPSIIINNGVYPAHLDKDAFITFIKDLVDKRLYHKSRKDISVQDKAMEAALKISVNTIYGLFGANSFPLYDEKCKYEVTINGQLMLLMLVEKLLLKGFDIHSCNTDGILVGCNSYMLDMLYSEIKNWEDITKLKFEYCIIKNFWQVNVSIYLSQYYEINDKPNASKIISILEKEKFKVKPKGSYFIPIKNFNSGYDKPIVAITCVEHLLNNKDPKTFMLDHLQKPDGIYDFCSSQRCDKKFTNYFRIVNREIVTTSKNKILKIPKIVDTIIFEKPLQRTIRYFVSNKGGIIIKKNGDKEAVYPGTKGEFVTLFNDYFEPPYDVNIDYYVKQVNDIVSLWTEKD